MTTKSKNKTKRIVNNIEAKYNDCFSFLYMFKVVKYQETAGISVEKRSQPYVLFVRNT